MNKFKESLYFKPNPDTLLVSLQSVIQAVNFWQNRTQDLADFFFYKITNSSDPETTLNTLILEYEQLNQVTLKNIFQFDFKQILTWTSPQNIKQNPLEKNTWVLGNGSILSLNSTDQSFTWENQNPTYSGDCLWLLREVEEYKLWQEGGLARHTIITGKTKSIRTFGWANNHYVHWYKNSLKLE